MLLRTVHWNHTSCIHIVSSASVVNLGAWQWKWLCKWVVTCWHCLGVSLEVLPLPMGYLTERVSDYLQDFESVVMVSDPVLQWDVSSKPMVTKVATTTCGHLPHMHPWNLCKNWVCSVWRLPFTQDWLMWLKLLWGYNGHKKRDSSASVCLIPTALCTLNSLEVIHL